MNKKKLPKVIVCGIGEMRPTALPSTADAEQPSRADANTLRDTSAAAQRPQHAGNVVQMIRAADPDSPEGIDSSKAPRSPQDKIDIARRSRALAIVNRHAAYSAVGGLIPVPLANFAGVTTVIVRMVQALCRHYGVPFKADRARAVVIGVIGGAMPTGAAAVTASTLLYLAPPAAVLGLAASCVTAAAFTRSAGRVFVEHFESGASLDAVQPAFGQNPDKRDAALPAFSK
jgi:uncharacterized protein (DUF697 family)